MAVAGRSAESTDTTADTLRDAGFVRVFAGADGDSLAATGLLARALASHEIPFQASVVTSERHETDATDDTITVLIGTNGPADVTLSGRAEPASETAFEVCCELDTDPDPVLALAGAFTAGGFEGSAAFETAREEGLIEQRPGVAVPVADLVDGLCHTTLVHAGFSGDSEATATALDGFALDTDDDRRRVASMLALSVCSGGSTPRAAETVERALRPHAITESSRATSVSCEFETIGGYADVLRACAHEEPGTGLALAFGHDVRGAALSAWRTHGKRAHAALRNATTERYRNAFVVRAPDAPLVMTARLACDFRSPEPVAVVVSESRAAAVAAEDWDLGQRMCEAGTAADGDGDGSPRHGQARFENPDEFVAAFREAIA